MAQIQRVGDLEINEDPDFELKDWTAQCAGWVFMGLIVFAAILGLLGGRGPLSQASAGTDDNSFRLDYSRFIHWLDPNELRLRVGPPSGQNELRISVSSDYLNHFSSRECFS
jgi:hypothetical protein